MKGIILAGGYGSRLYPLTKVVSKQLLAIYDKPMVYYPLAVLLSAGIDDILIISTERDLPLYRELLGNGSQLGISIQYKEQKSPHGIAEAFLIGETFIAGDSVCLILGDNLLHGTDLPVVLERAVMNLEGAAIFGHKTNTPEMFGIAQLDSTGKVISIEEKPKYPQADLAVIGLYFYDNTVVKKAKKLTASKRGELEITDINRLYMEENRICLYKLSDDIAWFDSGTPEGIFAASEYVKNTQEQTGRYVACIEEAAKFSGFISELDLKAYPETYQNSNYGKYVISLANGEKKI